MVLKIKICSLVLLLIYSSLGFTQVEKLNINQDKSSVEFLAIGNPSALKIKGEKAKASGQVTFALNAIGAKIKVDLNEFVTGIDMRDEHMKDEFFETSKSENRYATLEIMSLNLPESFWIKNEEWKGVFKGRLKLHNIENEITGDITFSPYKKGDEVLTVSHFPIKLTDFKISVPSFVGITVAEVVNVSVKLPLIVVEK